MLLRIGVNGVAGVNVPMNVRVERDTDTEAATVQAVVPVLVKQLRPSLAISVTVLILRVRPSV